MHVLILYPLQQVERQIVLHLSSEESATTGHLPAACGHVVVIILNDRIGNQLRIYNYYYYCNLFAVWNKSDWTFFAIARQNSQDDDHRRRRRREWTDPKFSKTLDTGSSMKYLLKQA
jgi:hypothetical protein